jgi:hypothetical protein
MAQVCRAGAARVLPWAHWLAGMFLAATLLLGVPGPGDAAELRVSEVTLEPCPRSDVAAQPDQNRSSSARCYALRGMVDTDVYARILDASGEPVLQNRTRVGGIGDVPPGRSPFALRLAVPAGTPDPLGFTNVKARGFSAPVRTRAAADDELLPLEQALQP